MLYELVGDGEMEGLGSDDEYDLAVSGDDNSEADDEEDEDEDEEGEEEEEEKSAAESGQQSEGGAPKRARPTARPRTRGTPAQTGTEKAKVGRGHGWPGQDCHDTKTR